MHCNDKKVELARIKSFIGRSKLIRDKLTREEEEEVSLISSESVIDDDLCFKSSNLKIKIP